MNILVIALRNFSKYDFLNPVQQISYVSLSYFTANHSFLQKLQMLTPVHNDANDANDTNSTDDTNG